MDVMKNAFQLLVQWQNRDAITQDEFVEFALYLTALGRERGIGAPEVSEESAIADKPVSKEPMQRRQQLARGRSGWVTAQRAIDLVLIALLNLEGPKERTPVIDYVQHRWEKYFMDADNEPLQYGGELRWQKNIQWGFHYGFRDRYIHRPAWGLQELTPKGQKEAERREQSLNIQTESSS